MPISTQLLMSVPPAQTPPTTASTAKAITLSRPEASTVKLAAGAVAPQRRSLRKT